MARISGIDLPRDKRIEIALTYIYGIGRKTASNICTETGVNPDIRVRDLSEDDTAKLRAVSYTHLCRLSARAAESPPVSATRSLRTARRNASAENAASRCKGGKTRWQE